MLVSFIYSVRIQLNEVKCTSSAVIKFDENVNFPIAACECVYHSRRSGHHLLAFFDYFKFENKRRGKRKERRRDYAISSLE